MSQMIGGLMQRHDINRPEMKCKMIFVLFKFVLILMSALSIASWNINCRLASAKPYLNELSKKADIIAVSEHGLFNCEMYKLESMIPGYASFGRASVQLSDDEFGMRNGIGGVAILWNSEKLSCKVRPLPKLGNDRICAIEINLSGIRYYVLSIYMPHQTCKISDFDYYLECLKSVVEEGSISAQIICVGDMNVHLSRYYGERCWGVTNRNENRFMEMVDLCNLTMIDICEHGSGPVYTFCGGNGMSYVDHALVSSGIVNGYVKCEVQEECIQNVSDHLAMITVVQVPELRSEYNDDTECLPQVAWHKMTDAFINETYAMPLEEEVRQVLYNHGIDPVVVADNPELSLCADIDTVNTIISQIVEAIHMKSSKLVHNQFKKALKPYWNQNLTKLSKDKKQVRKNWIAAGKPRNKGNPLYEKYKESKNEFRKEQFRRIAEFENQCMRDLAEFQEIDQRQFWHFVNKRGKVKRCNPVQNDNGTMITDPVEVVNEWSTYYENLYCNSNNNDYDHDFKRSVEDSLNAFVNEAHMGDEYITGGPITVQEVMKEIHSLKNRKAPGWDRITNEHLKKCGPVVKSVLAWLINNIVHLSEVPECYKRGLIVPIPKHKKDNTVKNNNRGITLLSVLYKILEKVIITRENQWIEAKVSDIQSACKKRISCLHSSLILQENVAYVTSKHETVHAAFLDTKKAFDSVWIEGLLYKLFEKGFNMRSWLLVKSSYQDFMCAAYVNGKRGKWFKPERGVHQGAPCLWCYI